ncbi:hypothetical protein DW083_09945 [Parabacteroides sp. AF48-14]|uniref:Mfa1 family fimbria major subunit n=1 Tax=Parabacteroides sp. AF48-14 TaxID=2292052 RepID=UPI000F01016D|nr:Mfa1 family fimbria major subunit [Parabacteroides sp. AF48-14]RHO72195.1 hypothetical protein DW083_09945 [Parabacteroides sp. AF48-14]
MKLKHYSLWALALAFAAVSCSDDLENSGKNNQPEESEQRAYLAVKIATGTKGVSTKGYGEEGDGYLPEIEGLNEDQVYDINIFLFEKKDTEHEVNGGLEAVNRDESSTTTQIAGYGYLAGINETPSGGREPDHQEVTVTITLDDTFTETESKDYWVLAVVNNGSQITPTTLSDLRENLSSKAWTGGASGINSYDKFVMSTHMMKGQVASASLVNISQANKSKDDPARTTVYVERLAARVDLKVSETMAGNIRTDGTFKVLRYLPINLWKGNTNMFKQVSPSVTEISISLPTETNYSSGEYQWLGDELWETGKYNYVYSVDMRNKTRGNYSQFTNKYDNFFYQAAEDADLPYDTKSTEWKETSTLGQEGTYTSADNFTPIFYTRENTMSAPLQMNGYTTGLIFESKFTFKDDATVSSYNSTNGNVEAAALPAGNNGTFYVANHDGNVTFDGFKTIAATAFKELAEAADGVDYKVTSDLLKGFMDSNWPATAPTIDKVRSIVQYMSEKNGIEKKFKEYLKEVLDKAGTDATFDNVKDNLNYNKFIDSETALQEPTGEIDDTYIATLYKGYGVSCYKEGKSYHKYWIQHDPSSNVDNAREDQVLGVMEYGIVRNNVYQLNVTGIRDLGDPLPYTPGKDDPDTPDEKEEAYTILVHLYVKDWILRKNQDITL